MQEQVQCVTYTKKFGNAMEAQQVEASFVSISKAKVPVYLQTGAFYHSLNSDDDDKMSIPVYALKPTPDVTSAEDLVHLLTSLRYWAVEEPQIEVFDYILAHPLEHIFDKTLEFEADFPYLSFLRRIQALNDHHGNSLTILDTALREGCLDVVKMLHRRGDTFSAKAVDHAVWGGNVECVQYVMQEGGCKATDSAFVTAYTHGYLSCLQYLHDQLKTGPLDPYACIGAANANQLESLKFLFANGYLSNPSIYDVAAEKGYLDCVKFLHEKNIPWGVRVTADAACGGQLEVLQYLHTHGCPWNIQAMQLAVRGGFLSCVKFLHEHGCPWDTTVCEAAASRGQLDCLKYLHELGCPWDEGTCNEAALYSHLECLVYAHNNGCPWGTDAYAAALRNKDEAIMAYLHGHSCEGVQSFQAYIDEQDAEAAAALTRVHVVTLNAPPWGFIADADGGGWGTGTGGTSAFGGFGGFGGNF